MSTVAPAPENPELVIRRIPPSITTFSVPFSRGNVIPFGGRSTAIQLADSSIWLLASHPLCPATLAALKELKGEVKYLVAPDLEHNMYLEQYARMFPQAKVYAPATIADKWNADPKKQGLVHHVFGKGESCPFEGSTKGEIKSADFGKAFVNEDIAFLHVPTKTLIEADLLFNLPPTEQYSKTKQSATIPFLTSRMKPGSWLQKRLLWHVLGKDKVGMSQNAKIVSAWDFDRIIPCHGDVIETGGKQAWDSTYEWFLRFGA